MKSIICNKQECYLCGSIPAEKHHCIHGRGLRPLAERWGLFVWLCPYHHRDQKHGVHGNAGMDKWFKKLAQNCFENVYGHEKWMQVIGRNYL